MGHLAAKVSNPHSPENLRKQEIKQAIGFTLGTAAAAAVQLGIIFGSMAHAGSIKEAQETPAEEVSDENTVIEENEDEIKEKIKNILTENNVEINEEHSNDIIKKYKAMKAVNPDITNAEVERRLTNYAKALTRKDQQLQMVKADPNDDTSLDLKVVDTDITPEVIQDQDKYLQALYNRGEGELSLYDLNGDNKVTEDEYIKTETGLTKMELLNTDEGTASHILLSNSFRKIDANNDGKLTADEFGASEYASYRLDDYELDEQGAMVEKTKTGNELSYNEFTSSTTILTGANDDPDDPERKIFTNLQQGAYNLLKDYRPQ